MISIADVIAAVAPQLEAWGPTTYGAQNIPRVEKPRRWVWVPISETFGAAEFRNGDLAKRLASVQIHCWGLTEAECEAMQAAVITAIREAVGGKRYNLSSAQWTTRQDSHRGAALVTTLTIELPMTPVSLPLGSNTIGEIAFEDALVEQVPLTPTVEE